MQMFISWLLNCSGKFVAFFIDRFILLLHIWTWRLKERNLIYRQKTSSNSFHSFLFSFFFPKISSRTFRETRCKFNFYTFYSVFSNFSRVVSLDAKKKLPSLSKCQILFHPVSSLLFFFLFFFYPAAI